MTTTPCRLAVLGVVALLAAAPAARAGVPYPPNCTVDHVIISSFDSHGANSGPVPCTTGQPGFDVWVRDINNLPVAGAVVSVQFAGSGTGIRPLLTQNPGATVVCNPNRTISVVADANGHAVMVPRFTHFSTSQTPTIPVYASGVLLTNVYAIGPDYDGDGAITLSDFSRFASDYKSVTPQYESDFDDCPSSRLADFAFFAEQYLWDLGHGSEPYCN